MMSQELQTFNSIQQLNWAWVYKIESLIWKQFDCLVCMVLESKYQNYIKNSPEEFKVKISLGTVDFKNMIVVPSGKSEY